MSHLTKRLGLLIALALGACTPAKESKIPSLQAYDNYRQMLQFDLIAAVDASPTWRNAPPDMRRKLALCTVELALADVEQGKMGEFDAYARDPAKLPIGLRAETAKLESAAVARSAKADLAPLMPYCKEDATAISKYAR